MLCSTPGLVALLRHSRSPRSHVTHCVATCGNGNWGRLARPRGTSGGCAHSDSTAASRDGDGVVRFALRAGLRLGPRYAGLRRARPRPRRLRLQGTRSSSSSCRGAVSQRAATPRRQRHSEHASVPGCDFHKTNWFTTQLTWLGRAQTRP